MTALLDAARQIHATLPSIGGEYLNDAQRELRTLADAAQIMERRKLPLAVDGEAALIRGMLDDIDPRTDAWRDEMTALIAERYPGTNLDWTYGVDSMLELLNIEMRNIGTTDHVIVTIDGTEITLPAERVQVDGDSLIIRDTHDRVLLDLHLRDAAAFGFADISGLAEGWTGFDLLTHDNRHIILR